MTHRLGHFLGALPRRSAEAASQDLAQCRKSTPDSTWLEALYTPGGVTGLPLDPAIAPSAVERWMGLFLHEVPTPAPTDWVRLATTAFGYITLPCFGSFRIHGLSILF